MATPKSKLDGQQVLQHAFDDTTKRLRVDSSISLDGGATEVAISQVDDSIRIGDGVDLVTTTTAGSKVLLDVTSSEVNYAIRTDETTTPGTTYIGYAAIGSSNSVSLWKIFRMVDVSNDLTIMYADGNDLFDNIWDNRASLTYS